jgi:hypothetical protein
MKPTAQPQYGPYIATRQPLSRRTFLRGTGIALALPFLDTMLPSFTRAATASSPLAPNAKPRRFFAINNNLGVGFSRSITTLDSRWARPRNDSSPM